MPTLLAIETSTDACSVALSCGNVVQETFVIQPREHNKMLLPMVEEILTGLRLTVVDLDAIAFGVGPGSFTGLRLSAGVVQGLAFAANKPVIPISSLAALAYSAGEPLGITHSQNILTILDARMQDIYFAAFRYEPTSLTRLADDALLSTSQLIDHVKNISDPVIIGDGWPSDLAMPVNATKPIATIYPHAKSVLALAKNSFSTILNACAALSCCILDLAESSKAAMLLAI